MAIKYTIEPLMYSQVELGGDLARQFRETADYYYGLNNDDMLKPYRERASMPAPGRDMGGVYVGHSPFGQFLAGYAKMFAVTRDEKYRDKALSLMDGWAETIEEDGFFFDTREPHLCAYIYEKLMGGLLDIYYYCGEPRALEYLKRITLWEQKHVPETREYCDVVGKGTGEWYTQSENLYRAYLYTGDEDYLRYAETWEYTEYWDEILSGDLQAMYAHHPWHHAYSHVNTFCGAAMAYIVKGDRKYLDILKAAYEFMQNEQCYATGGFGTMENLHDRETTIHKLRTRYDSFETQCGSWAGFKLSKYLLCLTGEAKYADWTEKLIINGIGASIPSGGTGKTFYYSEYRTSGAHKRYNHNVAWPCCSGTRPQAIAEYHDLIYFQDDDGIYAAQFFESAAQLTVKDTEVSVSQLADFPASDTLIYEITPLEKISFAFRFRLPGWLSAPAEVRVNGTPFEYSVQKGWGTLERKWSPGDIVEIRLPMAMEAKYMYDDKANPYAITLGPTVMAVRAIEDGGNPALVIDPDRVGEDFIPCEHELLTWEYAPDRNVTIKPFYLFRQEEQYFIYLDKEARMPFYSYKSAEFDKGWKDFGGWKTAFSKGLACRFSYTGKGVTLHAVGYPDCGIADVLLDGK
ncbi:MAG: glycoside hydrolase family 127 protein, partial [Abditibacteriota bacterium]|nr:glycoside hydrolase family 127 protein [Abditibacteriota bacterium]